MKHVERIKSAANDMRVPQELVWTDLNNAFLAYEAAARLNQNEGREDVIYLIYHFVETIAAFIVDNMLPEKDFGSMAPVGTEDKITGEPINKLLMWRMKKADVRRKTINLVIRGLIYGISWAKAPWSEEFRTVNRPVENIDPDTGETTVSGMELQSFLAYSGPDMVNKNIWDVWYDRYMDDLDGGWVIDREGMTVGEIENMKDRSGWQNVDRFLREVRNEISEDGEIEEVADDDNQMKWDVTEHVPGQGGGSGESRQIVGKNRIDVYEYWGPYDINDDGNYVTCVINFSLDKRTVFRVEPMPFIHGQLPWIACRPMPWLEEFAGISVAGVNVGKQNYLNDILKLVMENWERAVNPLIFRDANAKINDKELRFKSFKTYDVQMRPGQRIEDLMKFFQAPEIKGSSLAIFNEILSTAQRESSVEDFFSTGQTRGVTKTASGISQITERAGSRHKFKLDIIEDQTIARLAYQFFAMDQQFAQDEDIQPVLGEGVQYPRLPIESIIRWWDFTPIGSTTLLNKQADRENMTFFGQVLFQGYQSLKAEGYTIEFKDIMDGIAKKIDLPELADALQKNPVIAQLQALAQEQPEILDMVGEFVQNLISQSEAGGETGNGAAPQETPPEAQALLNEGVPPV